MTAVVSAIHYVSVRWGADSSDQDRRRLNKLVRRASQLPAGGGGGGWEEDVSQADFHYGQNLSATASDSRGSEQLL